MDFGYCRKLVIFVTFLAVIVRTRSFRGPLNTLWLKDTSAKFYSPIANGEGQKCLLIIVGTKYSVTAPGLISNRKWTPTEMKYHFLLRYCFQNLFKKNKNLMFLSLLTILFQAGWRNIEMKLISTHETKINMEFSMTVVKETGQVVVSGNTPGSKHSDDIYLFTLEGEILKKK